jgi:hypothetical protein
VTVGEHLSYVAGNDFLVIPIDFSNFNVGIYQNTFTGPFATSVTDVLTIGPVPEPSTFALAGFGVFCLIVYKQFRIRPAISARGPTQAQNSLPG